jgi:TPR repeat protein
MHRLAITALLLSLGATIAVRAQQSEAERQALARIKESAEKGDPHAQLELGMMYGSGARAYRDLVKAAKWHRKAADQGYAPAQYQVGLDYSHGDGVKVNQAEAAKWFRSAAEQGMVEAQYEIALCYLSGRGLPESGTAAVEWFRKAADQGAADAEFQLGSCYFQGTGVPKNIEEGIKWIRSAAEKGLPAAQARLGICYQKGEAVAKDFVQAYKWFALAGAQDDQHAADIKVSLATLESNLTKEQVLEAQRLASEFHPGKKLEQPGGAAAPTTSGSEIAKAGYVMVMTEETRSEVFVDGAFVGNPPAKLKLPEGSHVVEVKKSGFKDYRRELRVISGSDLTLKVDLEKK